MLKVYDWESGDDHQKVVHDTWNSQGDVHGAVAERFGITRQDAKLANWRMAYGARPLAEAEGAQQNETDGAAMLQQSSIMDATRAVASDCLLSDLHASLHRGERCPECGYCFEDIG